MKSSSSKSILVFSASYFLLALASWSGSNSTTTDTGNTTNSQCATSIVPTYAQVDFSTCTTCHASTLTGLARNLATVGVDFDTYEGAKANAARAVVRLVAGSMPPVGSNKPSTTVEQAIMTWSDCGTPQ